MPEEVLFARVSPKGEMGTVFRARQATFASALAEVVSGTEGDLDLTWDRDVWVPVALYPGRVCERTAGMLFDGDGTFDCFCPVWQAGRMVAVLLRRFLTDG